MRLLVLRTQEGGHLYNVAVSGLRAALRAHGQQADLFDYLENKSGLADQVDQGRYDAAISFGSLLASLGPALGPSVFEAAQTRFVGWHFDHPIYLSHNTSKTIDGRQTIHANRNHLRFAEAAAMPGAHTVLLPGAIPHEAPIKDFADREIDVFLAATWNGEPQRPWEALGDIPARHLIDRVIERLLAERETSVLDAFYQACGELAYGALRLDEQLFELLRAALNYVRHRDRLDVVGALADANLRLTLCGSGWEGLLGDRANVRLLPTEPVEQTRRHYGNAKVSINLNAGNGAGERVINAMLAGSCAVSDFSSALSEFFGPDEIRFFDRGGKHNVAHVVSDLLESGEAEAIATKSRESAMKGWLWEHRVDAFLSYISQLPR